MRSDFNETKFQKGAVFVGAQFKKEANFENAIFCSNYTNFNKATFKEIVDFNNAEFYGNVYFGKVNFCADADFNGAKFGDGADFEKAIFYESAYFRDTEFGVEIFEDSMFKGSFLFLNQFLKEYNDERIENEENICVNFNNVKFDNEAYFDRVEFCISASFQDSKFKKFSSFVGAKFYNKADFFCASFKEDVLIFEKTNFYGITDFAGAIFPRVARFEGSLFKEDADFRDANFIEDAMFSGTYFYKDLNLQRARIDTIALYCKFDNNSKINLTESIFKRIYIEFETIEAHLNDTDPSVYLSLSENFKRFGEYEDADKCYYKYRIAKQNRKNWLKKQYGWLPTPNSDKLMDYFACKSCGYGTDLKKPLVMVIIGISISLSLFIMLNREDLSLFKLTDQIITLILAGLIFPLFIVVLARKFIRA